MTKGGGKRRKHELYLSLSQQTNGYETPHPQHSDTKSASEMTGLITGVDHFTSDHCVRRFSAMLGSA